MDEKTINNPSINKFTFKARFKARKSTFMPKVVSRKVTINDAFESQYVSSISTFIPKLCPRYTKPHVMLHVSNGASSCLIRFKNPDELINALEQIIETLRSEKWYDAWWRIEDASEHLIETGEVQFNEEIVDVNAFHKLEENLLKNEEIKVDVKEKDN